MSAPNTTPGPWFCVEQNKAIIRSAAAKCEVARASEQYMDRQARVANAHLIAAAPELYEALERMLSKHCNDTGTAASDWKPHSAPFLALVALRKARGETA